MNLAGRAFELRPRGRRFPVFAKASGPPAGKMDASGRLVWRDPHEPAHRFLGYADGPRPGIAYTPSPRHVAAYLPPAHVAFQEFRDDFVEGLAVVYLAHAQRVVDLQGQGDGGEANGHGV